ncbi:MAG: MlaE family lipid ABC transporter permease subunit [Proteobacteria bacterium]|nr:MlaE family lipid ABC transporter permease subunit [Pseudomonadota bacterium]
MGEITLFLLSALRQMLRVSGGAAGQFARQCSFVGVESLPIILLTAFFTGGVLALQSFNGLSGGPLVNTQLGRLVALSMLRELGPVLAGLMLASRVGAAMAAELGTMRVTEQIDALVTLAANPVRYLVIPRVLATLLMLPLLVILANVMGIFGGYVVATKVLSVPAMQYMDSTYGAISGEDMTMALVKAAVFGLLVGLMATYHGFKADGGAAGVGQATTRAVVYGAVSILVADYFITAIFV